MGQGPLWIVEPPLSTGERMSVNDPEPTHTGLESGHSTLESTEHRGTPLAPRLSGTLSLSDSRN